MEAHLIGTSHPIKVFTDHKNLEYLKTKRMLNQRQTRWSGFMVESPWYAEYRPGKLGGNPDALTLIQEISLGRKMKD